MSGESSEEYLKHLNRSYLVRCIYAFDLSTSTRFYDFFFTCKTISLLRIFINYPFVDSSRLFSQRNDH